MENWPWLAYAGLISDSNHYSIYGIPYSRKGQEESLANSVLKRFGKGKFGEWHCELIIIIT